MTPKNPPPPPPPPKTPPPPRSPKTPPPPAGPKTTGLTLYSVQTLAKMWSCSRDHIYDLIAAGKLKATPLGLGRAKTRISDQAIADFIARGGVR